MKICTLVLVIGYIFVMFTACSRNNFNDWDLATYDFAPFPEGISFTPDQYIFSTETEIVSANLINTMEGAKYIFSVGGRRLIKLIDNEWRYVPWKEGIAFSTAAWEICNCCINLYEGLWDRRIIGINTKTLMYSLIPGIYRIVLSCSRLIRFDRVDDVDMLRPYLFQHVSDADWEMIRPYVCPYRDTIVWEGTVWTEFIVDD